MFGSTATYLVNSAFYPYGVWLVKYLAGVKAMCVHLCRVEGNTVWSHMAGDTP